MRKIGEVMTLDKNDIGFEPDGFDIARRDVITVSNLVDHMHAEAKKCYELMHNLEENNQVYKGNTDVMDQMALVTLTTSDAHDFLLDDKKTLGILEECGSDFDD